VIALWVALGAAVGAPTRYLTDRALQRRTRTELPVGTLVVNLVASFVLGVVTGAGSLSPAVAALVGTGFCGALSTWSTFAYEVAELRARALALGYLVLTLVAGLALAALGYALG
jgi:CrcB protein